MALTSSASEPACSSGLLDYGALTGGGVCGILAPVVRRQAHVRTLTVGLVAAGVLAGACACASGDAPTAYPNGIVVMGHSGATGYDSNPLNREADAPENSWATGDNPAVNSIYRRILARHPAIEGHAFNVARSGSDVNDLMRQARIAVSTRPAPDLFVIQSVDNDIQCDGTDAENYAPFATTLRRTLAFINERVPKAQIFMISQWATVENYTNAIKAIPGKRAEESGDELCSVFDSSGRIRTAGITALQELVDAYHARTASTCASVHNCRYDQGALQHMTVVPGDLSPDANHLSIQGQRKMAAVAWAALY